MTYPPNPDQSGQGGFQYDPYGSQPGSQPQQPGYSPQQPQQPGYGQPSQPPPYGAAPQLPPAAPGYPPQYGMPGLQPKNGLGVAGLVTGIIGLALFWCGIVGIVLAILGIVFGGVGIARCNRGEATNKGAATAGVVLGCIAIVLNILIWVWAGSMGLTGTSMM